MEGTVIAAIVAAVAAVSVPVIKAISDKAVAPKEFGKGLADDPAGLAVTTSGFAGNLIQNHSGTVNVFSEGMTTLPQEPITRPRSGPSGKEITESIQAAKPFDRVQVCKNYIGIDISWPVRFSSMNHYFNDIWSVTFMTDDKRLVFVNAHLSISRYPTFKILNENHPCWIKGRIKRADEDEVQLEDDAVVSFGDSAFAALES